MIERLKNFMINPTAYFEDPVRLKYLFITYYTSVLIIIGLIAYFLPHFSIRMLLPAPGLSESVGAAGVIVIFFAVFSIYKHISLIVAPLIESWIVTFFTGTDYSKITQAIFAGRIMENLLYLPLGILLYLRVVYDIIFLTILSEIALLLPLIYRLYISTKGISVYTDNTTNTSLLYLTGSILLTFLLLTLIILLFLFLFI